MNLSKLLNFSLKSDELIELFEDYDVDVIYSYDRLHEGMEDNYYGSINELGLQFSFDENQILKTIFIYVNGHEDFEKANLSELEISAYGDKLSVIKYAKENDIECTDGEASFLGENRAWAKLSLSNYSMHYEFREGILGLITLQANNA
tara:strand:+ start:977 stop:1420 length:444 start_codon:yes stop_codon:yes gene_type:complete